MCDHADGSAISVVLGSLNGNIEPAFQKLSALHAKNHFTFALITGNLFAAEQDAGVVARLLGADIGVPLSTYFTVGTVPLPDPVVERIESGEEVSRMAPLPRWSLRCCPGRRCTQCSSVFVSRSAKTCIISGSAA